MTLNRSQIIVLIAKVSDATVQSLYFYAVCHFYIKLFVVLIKNTLYACRFSNSRMGFIIIYFTLFYIYLFTFENLFTYSLQLYIYIYINFILNIGFP